MEDAQRAFDQKRIEDYQRKLEKKRAKTEKEKGEAEADLKKWEEARLKEIADAQAKYEQEKKARKNKKAGHEAVSIGSSVSNEQLAAPRQQPIPNQVRGATAQVPVAQGGAPNVAAPVNQAVAKREAYIAQNPILAGPIRDAVNLLADLDRQRQAPDEGTRLLKQGLRQLIEGDDASFQRALTSFYQSCVYENGHAASYLALLSPVQFARIEAAKQDLRWRRGAIREAAEEAQVLQPATQEARRERAERQARIRAALPDPRPRQNQNVAAVEQPQNLATPGHRPDVAPIAPRQNAAPQNAG